MNKNILLFFTFIFITGIASAQFVNIPDNNFRTFLQNKYPTSFNGSNMLDTTSAAILSESTLEIGLKQISDLTGIQYFKSLTYLDCSDNNTLTAMPVLPNTIQYLDCSGNNSNVSFPSFPASLTYLDISNNNSLPSFPSFPNSLVYIDAHGDVSITNAFTTLPSSLVHLDCSEYNILTLPALPASLKYLNCSLDGHLNIIPSLPNLDTLICSSNYYITTLPTLPNSLIYLDCSQDNISGNLQVSSGIAYLSCSYNKFTGFLPNLPNGLIKLNCSFNNINSLPTLPSSLVDLNCGSNPIYILPALPSSLTSLDCSADSLTSLPVLPNFLSYLYCAINQLVNLPALPDSLSILGCGRNQLISLPALPLALTQLSCRENKLLIIPHLPGSLTSLDCAYNDLSALPALPTTLTSVSCDNNNIYCLPQLPYNLIMLSFDGSKIQCFPNRGPMLFPENADSPLQNDSNYPLCTPANINNCHNLPVIAGIAFYDNNSNGIKDAGELPKAYLPIQLSNGSYTFTNSIGYYEIAITDSLGGYIVSVNPPTYFKGQPDSVHYTLTNYDTLITQNFAMQPTATIDSLSINLFGSYNHARPGTQMPFVVDYANVGTTTLSPNLTFKYDNSLLTYDSSSVAGVVNSGDSLSLVIGSFVPGQAGEILIYFDVKTSATLGDTAKENVSIAANATLATASGQNLISTSFDPNEKEATPLLTPQDVANGKAINYTIHFQNTGNDTAFNIIVADTLSNLLDAKTIQIKSSSKPCKITVKGNVMSFDFANVLLPDSSVSPLGSIGYVSFDVKPVSTVNEGTSINNIASIYFDYNTPVVTNTATTLIQSVIINKAPVTVPHPTNTVTINNPVQNSFTLKVNGADLDNTDATIFNSQGAAVKKIVLHSGNQVVDVSNLPSGAYYLKTQTSSFKIIVIK